MTKKFKLILRGEAATGTVIDAAILRDLLDLVVEGVRRSVRLRVEGRSTAPATTPAWLIEASAFRFVGIESGSACIAVEADSLLEQCPAKFGQVDMFIVPTNGDRTGVELLAESLDEALTWNLDSDYLDRPLVDWFANFKRLFSNGIQEFEMRGGAGGSRAVRASDIATFENLFARIPPSQTVRVAGKLDSVKASNRTFELRLVDESTLRGVFPAGRFHEFKASLGEMVVVTGEGDFKPSGTLRQLNGRSLAPSTAAEQALWSHPPVHLDTELSLRELKRSAGTGENHVIARLKGQWPGDETDEELKAALKEFL